MPASWMDRLAALATRRVLGLLIVIFLVLFLVVFPLVTARLNMLSGGVAMIDMQPSYSPTQVFQMVASYGPEGRPLYILSTLTADLLFPLDYSLLLSLLIVATYRQAFPGGRLLRTLALIPFLTAGFDLLENAAIVTLLSTYPQQLTFIAQLASLFTTFKWAFVLISLVLVLIGFVGLAAARLRQPNK